jgi:hypothetical protein
LSGTDISGRKPAGGKMKKILIGLMICLSISSYSYTRTSTLTQEAEKLDRAEEQRKSRLTRRKDKLEGELAALYENYNSRIEMTEKLKMDSEVRWFRDEYKEILKKYESVQDELEKEIEKKEKELAVVNRGLGIVTEKTEIE